MPPANATMNKDKPTYELLLIEDNPAEAQLLQVAFAACGQVRTRINVLRDSTRLIHYLHGQGPFAGATIPDLILLDYHHPINGGIALATLNGSPDLLHIPIVVITGSDDPAVFDEAYSRHANCVLKKPADLDGLMRMACDIASFWLDKAVLPRRRQPSTPSNATL